ncbi:MAG: porin family protein [Gammaproteobacteria bacterium]|nr:porin family protein [Gammaproteobacteria bacterium]
MHLLLTVLIVFMVSAVQAENTQLDVYLGWTRLDAGGNDEFKSGNALAVHYDYFLKPWLAADIGLYISDKTLEQSREDIVGNYRTTIKSQAILLGVKPRYRFKNPYEIFGRLGLQYWRTELEVEEYFGTGIPGGTDSAKDTGYGYYASFGGGYYATENVLVQIELRYMEQLDVFDGESQYPFDLAITSFSFGIGYRF